MAGGGKAVLDPPFSADRLTSPVVAGWTGVVTRASLCSDGRRSLAVRAANGVTLSTWRNAATDTTDNTLIGAGSELFHSTADLAPGTRVVFSGTFYPDSENCLRAKNMNQEDSMKQPDFLFRFTAICKQ